MKGTICAEHRSWIMPRMKSRDKQDLQSLGRLGWRVEIVWEYDLKKYVSLVVKQLTEILRDKH